MAVREFTDEQKDRFIVALVGYAVTLVLLLGLACVALVRAWGFGTGVAFAALTVSVAALGARHLFAAVNPMDPVEVPQRRW